MATYAFEALAVAGAAVGYTAATFDNANYAIAYCEGGAVRFRMDGTNPTATVGDVLEVGDHLRLESQDEIQRVRFIRRDGVSATLDTHFFV